MSGPPDVDYSATSLRPDWDALPTALRQELAVALGTEIVAAGRPVGGGFTGGFAAPVAGDTATHGDLRPDNLIVDRTGTFWTVDWNWLALGPRWMDWVGLLPSARHHGIDTATAVRNNPLTADVPAEHLDAFAAVLVAYFLNKLDEPPPPGCTPEIRRHQRLMAWVFLDWLGERRGW